MCVMVKVSRMQKLDSWTTNRRKGAIKLSGKKEGKLLEGGSSSGGVASIFIAVQGVEKRQYLCVCSENELSGDRLTNDQLIHS